MNTYEDFGEKFKTKLIHRGFASSSEIKGCKNEEIDTVMLSQSVDYLPLAYISFLRAMGKSTGKYFLSDLDFTYPELNKFKAHTQDAIDDGLVISDDSFVFMSRYGGEFFLYFETATLNPNPPVYSCDYGDEITTKRFSDSFTDFMNDRLALETGFFWNPFLTGKGFIGNFAWFIQRRLQGLLDIYGKKSKLD